MRTFHRGEFQGHLTFFFADEHGIGSIEVTVGGKAGGEALSDEKMQEQP